MFGQNQITNAFPRSDGSLLVNSHFYTIQGEGMDSGRPSYFVRLSSCNLRCHFCDTEFESGEYYDFDRLAKLADAIKATEASGVVITGGEPLLQNIIPFVKLINTKGLYVSVETAGTVYLDGLEEVFSFNRSIKGNLITCSPKTPALNKKLIPLIGAYKYIIRAGYVDDKDGLPNVSTQVKGEARRLFRPENLEVIPIYVQPCDEQDPRLNEVNMKAAVASSLKYGYDLSLQIHKIAGLE